MSGLEIALALLALGLAIVLFRQLREFRRLRRWAAQPRLSDPPEALMTAPTTLRLILSA